MTTRNRKSSDQEISNYSSGDDDGVSFVPLEETAANASMIEEDDIDSKKGKSIKKSRGGRSTLPMITTILSLNRGIVGKPPSSMNGTRMQKNSRDRSTTQDSNDSGLDTLIATTTRTTSPHRKSSDDAISACPESSSFSTAAAAASTTTATAAEVTKDALNNLRKKVKKIDGKKLVSGTMILIVAILTFDTLFSAPKNRIFRPDFAETFLRWVQAHPASGLIWIVLFMSIAVIFMVPIGTPITVGCGYIYKGAYGWRMGITIATLISMIGSALGAVICFLLGRYLMRDQVRKWIRKYPVFDAIDVASAEHGFRIMAMLYLTPILPLGPVSYMCGTTSMRLSSFVLAKIAAFPLMTLYAFIGASTGALLGHDANKSKSVNNPENEVLNIESNKYMLVSGMVLSFVMIAFISHVIRKELNKILERQQKHKPGETDMIFAHGEDLSKITDDEESALNDMNTTTAPRQRKH